MSLSRFSKLFLAAGALAFVVASTTEPAFAQHHGGGGGGHSSGGGHASSGGSRSGSSGAHASASGPRTGPPTARTAAPRSSAQATGVPGRPNGAYGYGTATPRGNVAYAGTNHYNGAYYNNGHYGGYYGGHYGGYYYAPVHYVAPYYHFHPWYSVGFGLYIGYPVAWSAPYYYPVPYYSNPYPYYPPGYPYASNSTTYDDYPQNGGTSYPSQYPQYPAGTSGSVTVQPQQVPQQQPQSQQNSGGVSFEITPSSAELFVDGVRIGTVGQFTPQSQPLGLSAGRHRIEIKAPGYQTISIDADIVAGQVIPYQGTMQH